MLIPEQELYDKIFEACQNFGYRTYDYLPGGETPYPFVELGNTQQATLNYKQVKGGLFSQTVHVWGSQEQRYEVAQMLERINGLVDGTLLTDHFRFVGRSNRSDIQIMNDTSVPDAVLKHGVITLFFNLG